MTSGACENTVIKSCLQSGLNGQYNEREKSLIEDWDNYPCDEEFFLVKILKKM